MYKVTASTCNRRVSVEDLIKSVEDFKMEHQATASTAAPSDSCSSSSYNDDASSPSSKQAQQVMYQKLYPIMGRPSNILSDYIVIPTVLGTGHYGTVRECLHRQTRQTYAVKSIEKAKIKRLDHLRREVDLLASVDHSSVIRLVNCYEDMNYVHIVTEKYSGGELFDKIIQRTNNHSCFDERSAARIIKSLLEAVAYLHANGIVHRDIKPENIIFETQEEDAPIKLIDFGLSRRHLQGIEPNLSNPVGTAYYMSPELLKCNYSAPTDIWSTGIVAYILLCGYSPFNGDEDDEIFDAISQGRLEFPAYGWMDKSPLCIDFVKCLLRRNPRKRYTAQEALMHPWILGMTTSEYPMMSASFP
jgi:serine/threonine protein kinase